LLGQLVPPMSLKYFILEYYSSPSFPSWLMDISHHLPNLTSITLYNLPARSNLPPLGQLPCLERLRLWFLPKVAKIDRGFFGGKGAFPRLARFALDCMHGLEEWNTTFPGEDGVEEFMFPMLDELYVNECPRLRLKPCPPKCRRCTIRESDQVISSLEEVQTNSRCCNRSTPTTSLAIRHSQHQSWSLFHHFPALQELELLGTSSASRRRRSSSAAPSSSSALPVQVSQPRAAASSAIPSCRSSTAPSRSGTSPPSSVASASHPRSKKDLLVLLSDQEQAIPRVKLALFQAIPRFTILLVLSFVLQLVSDDVPAQLWQ